MATSPYTSQAISGYNTSAPSDDGSETEANRIKWSTIKTKLPDPIKTLVEAINTQLVTAFGKVINTDANENNSMAGSLAFADSELTIATGSVTATRSAHTIDTQSDASSDDLDTIAVGSVSDGCILWLQAESASRAVTLKNGTGNLTLPGDVVLPSDAWVALRRNGSAWQLAAFQAAATQAQMEAASAVNVFSTPGRVQYHPGVAKAWLMMNGTGTPAVRGSASHNITSIADNGSGLYTITIETDMSSAEYAVVATGEDTGSTECVVHLKESTAPTATAAQIECTSGGTAFDPARISVVFLGDQA